MSKCNILKNNHIGKKPVILPGGWILDLNTSPNIWKVGVFLRNYELEQRLGKKIACIVQSKEIG